MADLSTTYTLACGTNSLVFNNGDLNDGSDLYWISQIEGLDGAPIRAPVDNAPQAHGGIVHTFWKGPRHITFEGSIVIQSVPFGFPCLTERNQLEQDLIDILECMIQTDGTLTWQPDGQSSHTLTVRHDVQLQFTPQENYAIMGFVFGLVAADPDF